MFSKGMILGCRTLKVTHKPIVFPSIPDVTLNIAIYFWCYSDLNVKIDYTGWEKNNLQGILVYFFLTSCENAVIC